MERFIAYLITNFAVVCVSIVLCVTLIRKIKKQKRISIYLLIIIGLTILITVLDALQLYIQYEVKDVLLTTIICVVLYVLRPSCLILFILLSGQKIKSLAFYLLLVPLLVTVVVEILPLIPATSHLVVYFSVGEDGVIHWHSGDYLILRFMPHIVSIIYLAFLIYKSISLLKRKHIADAIGILICFATVTFATILETFFNDDGTVYLLPTSIAMSTIFFYLFLYERNNQIDILTGLFNRDSYFDDFSKLSKEITSIIQLDMNGLKYLNDNYGHLEGDNGLKRVAEAIENNISKKMYAYRLGGDEFIVLAINENEENVLKFAASFKQEIKTTKYYCSLGYAYKNEQSPDVDSMFKLSEQRMYEDKAEFYKTANIDRRKSSYINKE